MCVSVSVRALAWETTPQRRASQLFLCNVANSVELQNLKCYFNNELTAFSISFSLISFKATLFSSPKSVLMFWEKNGFQSVRSLFDLSLSLLFLFTRTNERTNKQTDTNYNTKYLLPYLANSFGSTPCASLINTGVVGLAAFNFSYDFRRKFLAPSECLDVWHKWKRNSCTALRPANAFDIIIILCILIIYGGSSLDDWLLLLSSRTKCVLFVVQSVLCDGLPHSKLNEDSACCFRIEKSSDWLDFSIEKK